MTEEKMDSGSDENADWIKIANPRAALEDIAISELLSRYHGRGLPEGEHLSKEIQEIIEQLILKNDISWLKYVDKDTLAQILKGDGDNE